MEIWQWLLFVSMFAVGGLVGYALSRGKSDNMEKVRELEQNLTDAQQEMNDYKMEVSQHFGETAQLFNTLTDDYRAVYEHLAIGSQALCGDKVTQIVSEVPEKKLLDAEPENIQESAIETKPETAPVTQEATPEEQLSEEKTEKSNTSPVKETSPEDAARTIH